MEQVLATYSRCIKVRGIGLAQGPRVSPDREVQTLLSPLPLQPRSPGQVSLGKALLENLCMKAINQSIGELPRPWEEWLGLDGWWGEVTAGGRDIFCLLSHLRARR